MSSSESEFYQDDSPSEPIDGHSRAGSHTATEPPFSPRKRPRSRSVISGPIQKRPRRSRSNEYKDAYRVLYNETVTAAASRFVKDTSFQSHASRLGLVQWSAHEKSVFFAALERLGKDDVPGIANAIGSKSIPETRSFLLLIQDELKQRPIDFKSSAKSNWTRAYRAKVTLQDIPAALEISPECERHLESAGDALAWFQEGFEAKKEQERYGSGWLITPEIAEEIKSAVIASEAMGSTSSRSSPADNGKAQNKTDDVPDPQILQDIPEAKLLNSYELLKLSRRIFMNPSPTVSYPWHNWSELGSEFATEPSIYRTAFNDLHTLVISLTRRLVQAAIVQATSRIRAQGWRNSKGVQLLVKPRDVLTAVDILGLSRNGRERWRSVARRCGLRVLEPTIETNKRFFCQEDWSREVSWDEVEQILTHCETSARPLTINADTAGPNSEVEDEGFRSRAARSGTPLPTVRPVSSRSLEGNGDTDEILEEDSESDAYQLLDSQMSDTSGVGTGTERSLHDASEDELEALEEFDQAASRGEELQLRSLIEVSPSPGSSLQPPKAEAEGSRARLPLRITPTIDDWRTWTKYRAPWEEHRTPVPHTSFFVKQKLNPSAAIQPAKHESYYNLTYGNNDLVSKERLSNAELPIRGAMAFAAMQGRISRSEDHDLESDAEDIDADVPAPSIEEGEENSAPESLSEDDTSMCNAYISTRPIERDQDGAARDGLEDDAMDWY